ncbi:amidohydrolase family protein [Melioribacteraceae bacterium 4301-Me]|uniref:amidohydrolase family protein n=1 Tax=Pyranulibacter aquaticus TaxID=3163344 RepID=UPI003597336C
MKTIKIILLVTFVLLVQKIYSQRPVPAQPESKSILLVGGTAHIGDGTVITNSLIGFDKGKITLVANADKESIDKSKFDKVIDVTGKQVYPGFILPNTTLGLVEIEAVRATQDYSEVGSLNPNVRSLIAYNTDSKVIPTVRDNGVLIAQVTPRSGIISGSSSIFNLDGWNWEDAVLKADDGIHLNWSNITVLTGGRTGNPELKKNDKYDEYVNTVKKFFADAKAYSEAKEHKEKNLKFEAMRGLFDGSKNLYIHEDNVREIQEAVNIAKETGVKKIVLVGGADAWMITDFLKENNIPVIVKRDHSLPPYPESDVYLPYKLPYLLVKAGLLVALDMSGSMEAMNGRNLPFLAGTAAAYGLTKEEALKTITSNTAKILGIDDKVGTLEIGKDATLFISTGDALDMKTNNVEMAFIQGKALDLRNEQKELYIRYMHKYGLM